jgi:short-subunit dehydrogenase
MKIFVTGVSSGIGRELAKQLVAAGHEVWGMARNQETLESLKHELNGKLRVSVCDLQDIASCRQLASQMRAENFLPDACILNAGVYLPDLDGGLKLGELEKTFHTNFFGVMFWIGEFLPDYLKRRAGKFLAISSTSAYRPGYHTVGYPASKAALSMAMRGLRLNYADSGVGFTTVHFGPINTHMWEGKRSFLVPEATAAAAFAVRTLNKQSGSYYFPFLSTTLFRLIRFLPDRAFTFFGRVLRSRRN